MLWSVTTLSDGNATQYLRQYNLKTGAQSMPQVALNNSEYEHATFFLYFFFGCHQRLHTYAHTPVRTYARAHNGSLLFGVHPCVLTCMRVESPGCRTAIKGRTWRLVSTSSTQSTESSSGWYGATPPACIELERILVRCGPRHPGPPVMGSAAAPSVSSKVGYKQSYLSLC